MKSPNLVKLEYSPSVLNAWRIFFVVQLLSTLYNYISDCDEVFNYWEGAHMFQFSRGLQTWEYSPVWALRSYAFVAPLTFFTNIVGRMGGSKILQFYFARGLFGLITSICQAVLYNYVRLMYRGRIALFMLVFMALCPGMFVAGTAFLPSSIAMNLITLATGFTISSQPIPAGFSIAFAALYAWPFAALAGIPMFISFLPSYASLHFFLGGLLSLVPFGVFMSLDGALYKRFTIPTWNIVQYNVLGQTSAVTSNPEGEIDFEDGVHDGSALYGTEPWHWYFRNLLLNFNLAFVCALVSLPLILISRSLRVRAKYFYPAPFVLLSFYLWLGFFSMIPHKEERFMFVIYGPLCLAGAIGLVALFDTLFDTLHACCAHGLTSRLIWLCAFTCAVAVVALSLARTAAITHYYGAPLEVYGELSTNVLRGDACWTGKHQLILSISLFVPTTPYQEWYRFPSSYFLPGNRFNLSFIPYDGQGAQLPQYGPASPAHVLPHFNSRNRDELTRYIPLESCHFVVDFDHDGRGWEAMYSATEWERVVSAPFLQADKSPNFWQRAFYIPFMSDSKNSFGDYFVLKKLSLLSLSHCDLEPYKFAEIEYSQYPATPIFFEAAPPSPPATAAPPAATTLQPPRERKPEAPVAPQTDENTPAVPQEAEEAAPSSRSSPPEQPAQSTQQQKEESQQEVEVKKIEEPKAQEKPSGKDETKLETQHAQQEPERVQDQAEKKPQESIPAAESTQQESVKQSRQPQPIQSRQPMNEEQGLDEGVHPEDLYEAEGDLPYGDDYSYNNADDDSYGDDEIVPPAAPYQENHNDL